MFFLNLFPALVQRDTLLSTGFAEVATLIVVILSTVLGCYVLLAARAHYLFALSRAVRKLNRGTGIAIAGAAVATR